MHCSLNCIGFQAVEIQEFIQNILGKTHPRPLIPHRLDLRALKFAIRKWIYACRRPPSLTRSEFRDVLIDQN